MDTLPPDLTFPTEDARKFGLTSARIPSGEVLRNADRIVVVDRHGIVEQGSTPSCWKPAAPTASFTTCSSVRSCVSPSRKANLLALEASGTADLAPLMLETDKSGINRLIVGLLASCLAATDAVGGVGVLSVWRL
jgi:hypothetical protein